MAVELKPLQQQLCWLICFDPNGLCCSGWNHAVAADTHQRAIDGFGMLQVTGDGVPTSLRVFARKHHCGPSRLRNDRVPRSNGAGRGAGLAGQDDAQLILRTSRLWGEGYAAAG